MKFNTLTQFNLRCYIITNHIYTYILNTAKGIRTKLNFMLAEYCKVVYVQRPILSNTVIQ
jgi:hypothetical protein